MKKAILLSLFVCAGVVFANAQDKNTPPPVQGKPVIKKVPAKTETKKEATPATNLDNKATQNTVPTTNPKAAKVQTNQATTQPRKDVSKAGAAPVNNAPTTAVKKKTPAPTPKPANPAVETLQPKKANPRKD